MTAKITARIAALRAMAADTRLPQVTRDAYAEKADQLVAKYGTASRPSTPTTEPIIIHFPGCQCFDCRHQAPASEPQAAAEEPTPAAAPRARTSHAHCSHAATKAGRAACRKARAAA